MPEWTGTLTDDDIRDYASRNNLITENYDQRCVQQACYELRAGRTYYDLACDELPRTVTDDEYILLKPQQIVVIITHEQLKVPHDILGRVLTKGSLFSLGVIPINTYADPGFQGNLGIVFQNTSTHYIKIRPLQPIAKMEFSKLHIQVSNPYHGQHGYGTGIWPVAKQYILSNEEIKRDKRVSKDVVQEISETYGGVFGKLVSRIFIIERRLLVSTILYFILNLLLIGIIIWTGNNVSEIFSPLLSVLLGLGSNILFAFLSWALIYQKRR